MREEMLDRGRNEKEGTVREEISDIEEDIRG